MIAKSSTEPTEPQAVRCPPEIPAHTLVRCIGRGSYGEVWLAKNVIGTYRAIKIVNRQKFDDDRPFQREFHGIQKFEPISRSHDGLMDILQVGQNETEQSFYYVMELADDIIPDQQIDPDHYQPRTLRRDAIQRGCLSPAECVSLGLALTDALGALHQNGLVHRDIKPSNIIFVNGLPKLADIGLVTDIDATFTYVGTEGFIAPEGPGTPQADLYSLGKVLYEISTGKDRQEFPDLPTSMRSSAERAELLELNEVLLKACLSDPRKRYQTAEEMHADLALLRSGKSVRRLRKVERRLAMMTRISLATLAVIVLGAIPYIVAIKEARRANREAERARLARSDAQEKLWNSYLVQAQARRWSGRIGRRFESLEVLRKAAEIRPSVALRNEAIACMTLLDMRTVKEWDVPADSPFAFDSKYERYAWRDKDGTIRVQRVADGGEVMSFPGFAGAAVHRNSCLFSPDGRYLLIGTNNANGAVFSAFDLVRREIMFSQSGGWVRAWCFSSDNRLLAVVTMDSAKAVVVVTYEIPSGKPLQSFPLATLPWGITFDPGGHRLAVSRSGGPVEIWDWRQKMSVHRFSAPASVLGTGWHPDSRRLATACANGHIYVWDVEREQIVTVVGGHTRPVIESAFSHNGELLQSISWDGTVRLWDANFGQELLRTEVDSGLAYRLSADVRWLAYAPGPSRRGLWEVSTSREWRLLNFRAESNLGRVRFAYTVDGRLLAAVSQDKLRVWDAATGLQVAELPGGAGSVCFHPSGRALLVCKPSRLELWPLESTIEGSAGKLVVGPPEDFLSGSSLVTACVDGAGQTVAVNDAGNIRVFDFVTRRERCYRNDDPLAYDFALSPDSRWCASWPSAGDRLRLWELATDRMTEIPANRLYGAVFSPNGGRLVTVDLEECVVWETGSWKRLNSFKRPGVGSYQPRAAFAPDGGTVAITYSMTTVRLFDPASGRELATLEPPESREITWLAFSPDGGQLAVANGAEAIHLWDLRLIRQRLADMKLDWESPPYPPASRTDARQQLSVKIVVRPADGE